jgi:hypothetical protein
VSRALALLLVAVALLAAAIGQDRQRPLLIDQATTSTVTRASLDLCEPPPDPDQLLPKPDDLHPYRDRQGGEA